MASFGSRMRRVIQKIKKTPDEPVVAPVEAAAGESATGVIPPFVLAHAPVVYLDKDEKHWPGSPVDHLKNVVPLTLDEKEIAVTDSVKGKPSMLLDSAIRNLGGNVFLSIPDARNKGNDPVLTSPEGKPDADGKSHSPCFIVIVDKTQFFATAASPPDAVWDTQLDGKNVVDVFYFYFYPYNLGNKVLLQNFGNHIGDWEHNMIRFIDGTPRWIHFSAHSDGAAYAWEAVEKTADGNRPIDYAASGSHANYPTAATHAYSGVPIFGPKDHTSKGFLWDPLKNWVASNADTDSNFHPLPDTVRSLPGYNQTITSDDIWGMLAFEGRWGNSFSQLRQQRIFASFSVPGFSGLKKKLKGDKGSSTPRPSTDKPEDDKLGQLINQAESQIINAEAQGAGSSTAIEPGKETEDPAAQAAAAIHAENGGNATASITSAPSLTLYQKLLKLIWAEGPTGPRDKSLGRRMVNRWTQGFFVKLP